MSILLRRRLRRRRSFRLGFRFACRSGWRRLLASLSLLWRLDQSEAHDAPTCPDLCAAAVLLGFLGLSREEMLLELLAARNLLVVMQTFEVVFLLWCAFARRVGVGVALLELLPEDKAARAACEGSKISVRAPSDSTRVRAELTALEAETGLETRKRVYVSSCSREFSLALG